MTTCKCLALIGFDRKTVSALHLRQSDYSTVRREAWLASVCQLRPRFAYIVVQRYDTSLPLSSLSVLRPVTTAADQGASDGGAGVSGQAGNRAHGVTLRA